MAEVLYKRALTILEKSFGPNHIEVAEVLNSMGLVLKKRADYDGAEACYKRAILIVHNTFGDDQEHYKLGIYYNNLADLDRKRTKFDNALRLYQRALTAIEKTLGLQHSEAAEILHNIGQVQHQLGLLLREKKEKNKNLFIFFLGNYKEAIDRINQALMIIKKEFGDTHYKYGMFLNSFGLAYAMTNDYKSAYVHLKQALQILLSCLGQDHIEVCDIYSNLGDYCMKIVAEMDDGARNQYEKMLKLEEAKKYYTEAERIVQATFGVEHTKAKQFLSLLYIIDNYDSL
jgi:tetratricopeptide (TPR) repeat protein